MHGVGRKCRIPAARAGFLLRRGDRGAARRRIKIGMGRHDEEGYNSASLPSFPSRPPCFGRVGSGAHLRRSVPFITRKGVWGVRTIPIPCSPHVRRCSLSITAGSCLGGSLWAVRSQRMSLASYRAARWHRHQERQNGARGAVPSLISTDRARQTRHSPLWMPARLFVQSTDLPFDPLGS